MMKLAIIGAGAMGSLLGFYLSQEADVWLLDPWQEHVDAINRDGLARERDGVVEVAHPRATTDPATIGPCDTAIVLVKAQQTRWAAEQVRQIAQVQATSDESSGQELPAADSSLVPRPSSLVPRPSSLVPLTFTLQNGVGNRELLAELLGADRVGQGVTSLGATLLGPGRVRHGGQGATVFGTAPDRVGAAALAELFSRCGLPASLEDDLDSLVWGKVVVNVGINALTALLRVHNGALTELAEARRLVELAVAEAVAVAAARGTALPYSDPLGHVLAVAAATAANRSSMLQDVLRGSPTEIATINGAIVREGQRLGVATPVNEALTLLVAALDALAIADKPGGSRLPR